MLLRPTLHTAPRQARRAFTLMEVLVVVAIIFILASVSTVVVFRYLDESKDKMAAVGVKTIDTAVRAFKVSHGDYPQSLEVLCQPLDGKPASLEEKALLDPWERPYQYDLGQRHPTTGMPLIYSAGSEPGTSAPIRNWQ